MNLPFNTFANMLEDSSATISDVPTLQMDLTSFIEAEQSQISIDERRKMAEDIDEAIKIFAKEKAELDKANEGIRKLTKTVKEEFRRCPAPRNTSDCKDIHWIIQAALRLLGESDCWTDCYVKFTYE